MARLRMSRRSVKVVALILVLGAPAHYLLVRHSPDPSSAYDLDIAKIRALADSAQGDKASAIRYEHVMSMRFFEAMLMAGDPWTETPMPVYSYQLVFPDRTLIVDTAVAREQVKPEALILDFDDASYQRMNAAMARAAQIVITHEHMDHIGGIAAHPQLAQLRPVLRLTAEQLANPKGMDPVKLPAEPMQGYQPLQYGDLLAIAPGVVLIKAPGHTPGSQMVYVKRADGRELLFLGDVTWRIRNIEHVRERPLFMTLLIGEKRQPVLAQFEALHALREREPAIALVPGHDGQAVRMLAEAGLLQPGFQ